MIILYKKIISIARYLTPFHIILDVYRLSFVLNIHVKIIYEPSRLVQRKIKQQK